MQDPNYKKQNNSGDISSLFGNVSVIDEIERATLDEIYRVIETIERFRNESISGFPLKLIFILCFARDGFKILLDKSENDYRSQLIKNFFFDDQKTNDLLTYIPMPSIHLKNKLLVDTLKNICNKLNVYESTKLDNIEIPYILNQKCEKLNFLKNDQEHLEHVLGHIVCSSPRIISCCILELNFSLQMLKNNQLKTEEIGRLGEFLLVEYVKLKYLEIFQFFRDLIASLPIPEEPMFDDNTLEDLVNRFPLGSSSSFQNNKILYENLICLISFSLKVPKNIDSSKFIKKASLSAWDNFLLYFYLIKDPTKSMRARALYISEENWIKNEKEKRKNKELLKIDDELLSFYVSVIFKYDVETPVLHAKLVNRTIDEIIRRISENKHVNKTLIVKLVSLMLWLICPDNELDKVERTKYQTKCKKQLYKLLSSETILPYIQYKVIEEFKKKDNDATSPVRTLQQSICDKNVALKTIGRVRKKYYEKGGDIYENGDHDAMYVLYESMSNDENIEEISEKVSIQDPKRVVEKYEKYKHSANLQDGKNGCDHLLMSKNANFNEIPEKFIFGYVFCEKNDKIELFYYNKAKNGGVPLKLELKQELVGSEKQLDFDVFLRKIFEKSLEKPKIIQLSDEDFKSITLFTGHTRRKTLYDFYKNYGAASENAK